MYAHLVLNVVRLGEIELITCMKNVNNYCWYGRQAMEHDIHAVHMLRNVMQHWWELQEIGIIAGGKTALSSQLCSKSPAASSLKLEVQSYSST